MRADHDPLLDAVLYAAFPPDHDATLAAQAPLVSPRPMSDAEFIRRGQMLRASTVQRAFGVLRFNSRLQERPAGVRATPVHAVRFASDEGAVPLIELAAAAGAGRELWDEECDRWIALPEGIAAGRHIALRIRGDSMTPLVPAGSTVLVRLDSAVRRRAIVIAFVPDAGYVCKRVRATSTDHLELDSIAAAGPSFSILRTPDAIVGTVVGVWPAMHPGESSAP